MKRLVLTVLTVVLLGISPAFASNGLSADDQPASDTDAVATLSANPDLEIEGVMVHWSYSGTPTGGKLTIKAGSTVISEVDITSGGVTEFATSSTSVYSDTTYYNADQIHPTDAGNQLLAPIAAAAIDSV